MTAVKCQLYNMAGHLNPHKCFIFSFGRVSLSVELDGFLDHARFILFIIVSVACGCVLWIFTFGRSALDYTVIDVLRTMEKSIKKRNQPETVINRSSIGANWQQLLKSSLMTEEKPAPVERAPRFEGTFRRARRRHRAAAAAPPMPDLQNLEIEANGDADVDVRANKDKPADPKSKLTKYVAMDCEMVGTGPEGRDHMLARVSIVNRFGECVLDSMVQAREEVTDYRTKISGIRKEDMLNGEDFKVVQNKVSELLRGRVLVGHSLKNDLAVLFLSHPKRNIRDTSRYKPFRKITRGGTPSLKHLAKELLGVDIQGGEHSSVEDARAAMQLYCSVAKQWEAGLSGRRKC